MARVDPMPDPDPLDSDSYRAFIIDCAKACRCCPECSDVPCGACMAGGVCDAFECECSAEADNHEWGDADDDYE